MNINSTPILTNQTQMPTGGTDALSLLGDQLLMDPTIQALLQDNADSKGVDFETLLKNTQTDEQKAALMKEIGLEVEGEQEVLFKGTETTQVPDRQTQQLKSELEQVQAKKQDSELVSVLNLKDNVQKTAKPELNQVVQGKETELSQTLQAKDAELGQVVETKKSHVQTSMFKTKAIQEHQAMAGKTVEAQVAQATKNKVVPVEVKQMEAATKEAIVIPKEGKLLDLNQFMAKQSNSNKMKVANKSGAYRGPQKSIFSIGNKSTEANTQTAKVTNLQDVIYNKQEAALSQMDQNSTNQEHAVNKQVVSNNSPGPSKVLNMNQVDMSGTVDEVITKIQNYILQSKASNEKSVQISFTHQDLGKVDLLVQKGHGNAMNISIASNTAEATQFFTRNQGELLTALSTAGIQVGDFKLETSASGQNLSQKYGNQGQSRSNENNQDQHNSQSGQRQEESQKRKELWELMQDKEVA